MKKSTLLPCLLLLFTVSQAGIFDSRIKKAYHALNQFNYFRAKQLFYSQLKKQTVCAAYGLATIYSRNDNPFYNLDSAHRYIFMAENKFNNSTPKQKKSFEKYRITSLAIHDLREAVNAQAYDRSEEHTFELQSHSFIS